MFRKISCIKRCERGQSLVEFALLLPVLLLGLLVIIQFGLLLGSQLLLSNAAKEGVRLAAVGNDYTLVENRIGEITAAIPVLQVSNISISPEEDARLEGENVKVKITSTSAIIVPLLDRALGDKVSLSAEAVMRYELPTFTSIPPEDYNPTTVGVDKFDFYRQGNTLHILVAVSNDYFEPVQGVAITVNVYKGSEPVGTPVEIFSGNTGVDGTVSWERTGFRQAHGNGTYVGKIVDVDAGSLEWDGVKITRIVNF